jgi:hypothetical protein
VPEVPATPSPESAARTAAAAPAAKTGVGKVAANKNALIGVVVGVAVVAIAIMIVTHNIKTSSSSPSAPAFDSELLERAKDLARTFSSVTFEGYDPSEPIKHYYFIPIIETDYNGIPSEYKTGYMNYTDSGVRKAKAVGYSAKYGICVYRKGSEILAFAAPVL